MTWVERRDLTRNRRANGWRWGAARSDRRKPLDWSYVDIVRAFQCRRMGDRRQHNRRKADRDDEPRLVYARSGLPVRIEAG
jgi:hypothetical protein